MAPDSLAERRVGTTLRDKWTLERLLGEGGMAAVYLGVHKIGRRVAIKILHPEIARSRELRARFEQEAHAVNRLLHPGVVAIHDIEVAEDGAPFLVMELLEGESLADRARRLGRIDPGEMLRLVDELLDVLAAAHAQGIIHRDIKLDNLFVQRDGRLKVLDFGIARVRDGMRSLHTRTGAALGTTPYMAPEQIIGVDVDARVDIFAVGATMFRLVAGRRVHEAENEQMLMVRMATQPAPPLASVAPGTPPAIARVVDRALQFERNHRYPDALTMQRDVQALRAGGNLGNATVRMSALEATAVATAAPATADATSAGPIAVAQATKAMTVPTAPPKQPATGVAKKWIAIYALCVLASVVLLVVFVLIRRASQGVANQPGASGSATVDPDDPSWRPSSAKRSPAASGARPPTRRPGEGDADD
jgi:serine/threonine-protein kinase